MQVYSAQLWKGNKCINKHINIAAIPHIGDDITFYTRKDNLCGFMTHTVANIEHVVSFSPEYPPITRIYIE